MLRAQVRRLIGIIPTGPELCGQRVALGRHYVVVLTGQAL